MSDTPVNTSPPPRVVVLIDNVDDRTIIINTLGNICRLMVDNPAQALSEVFDLCITDLAHLHRYEDLLAARKQHTEPGLIPVLAVVDPMQAPELAPSLQRSVDELLLTPLKEIELRARVAVLLRGRRQALAIACLNWPDKEQARAYLQLAVEVANIGLWDWHLESGKVFFSPQWKHQIGYEEGEVTAEYHEWESRLHPDESPHIIARLHAYLRHPEGDYQAVFRIRHKNNSYRWIQTHGIPLFNAEGKLIRLLGIHIDITERKLAEETIIHERNFANAIIDSLPGVFNVFDRHERLLRWNKNFETVTGYSRAEMSKYPIRRMLSEPDREPTRERIEEAMRMGQAQAEVSLLTKDGHTIPYFITGKRIELDGEVCIIGMGFDISRRKATERQLKQSLCDKEVLLQELYHRTRNSMQVISSLLQIQAASSTNREIRGLVTNSLLRIRAMALAHEKLYQSRDLSRVDMREYLTDLTRSVLSDCNVPPQASRLHFDIDTINLLIDLAIPCGLIVNELLSECLQQNFARQRPDSIAVGLHENAPGLLTLRIRCSGHITERAPPKLSVVNQIVRHQLHGSISATPCNGIQWEIRFRTTLYTERVKA